MEREPLASSVKGYLHPKYARSLAEFGAPRSLARCGGWILERGIPGTSFRDAMGCYPLFCCEDWSALENDLSDLQGDLVSVSLVADPFGSYSKSDLESAFHDLVRPFKAHYVVDLRRSPEQFVSAHHQRNARKGLRALEVAVCTQPGDLIQEWAGLYDNLIARHGLTGLHRFSTGSFERQLRVPGCIALTARTQGELVGMLLWYENEDLAYYHLGAFSSTGYRLQASFALFWTALHYFATMRLTWLSLGGGAGLRDSAAGGLARFKRGWATETRMAYHCGRVLDRSRYAELCEGRARGQFFPDYRQGGSDGSMAPAGRESTARSHPWPDRD